MILYRCFGSEAYHTNASPAVIISALQSYINKWPRLRVTKGKSSVTDREDLESQSDPSSTEILLF